MTRAQRAMALAMIAPEPDGKGGRGKTFQEFGRFRGKGDRKAMRTLGRTGM